MPPSMMTEKRRSPRIPTEHGTRGLIRSTIQVAIADISLEGLSFHVTSPLRPGASYSIAANLRGFALATQIRITRCKAAGAIKDGRGGQVLLFQVGAEFIWADPKEAKPLSDWIKSGVSLGTSAQGGIRLNSKPA